VKQAEEPKLWTEAGTPTPLHIGALNGGSVFDGVVDEPSVWKVALSASEVAALYAAGGAAKCTKPQTPP
jgi:hypothetical protein